MNISKSFNKRNEKVIPIFNLMRMNQRILSGTNVLELNDGNSNKDGNLIAYFKYNIKHPVLSRICEDVKLSIECNEKFMENFDVLKSNGVSIYLEGDDYIETISFNPDKTILKITKKY